MRRRTTHHENAVSGLRESLVIGRWPKAAGIVLAQPLLLRWL